MGRSAASTPTPRGNTLDGQLRLSFRQVLRNGAMGIDQCAFVGAHFGVDSATVRKSFVDVVPGGGTVDEATFLDIMQHAMHRSKLSKSPSERPRMINKNSAMLHKEMSINPFVKLPIVLPRPIRESTDLSAVPTLSFDKLSPAHSKRPKLPSHLITPSMRLNRSADYGPGVPSDISSPIRERSQSVPLTARTADSGADSFQKPGSAAYLRPYTPRSISDLPTWKWNQLDNNVPRNIRNVLLKPMRLPSRAPTPPMKSPELKAVLDRMKRAMQGITRIECIRALSKTADCSKDARVSIQDAQHALQSLGFQMTEHEVVLLAEQCKALSADGGSLKAFVLTNAIIPVASRLSVADVGIDPEQFAKFKKQRLSFTRALSTKEVKLLELLRSKLVETCLGGPGELRKAFKLVDAKQTGRCNLKEMVLALELNGLGLSQTDAEVLYAILDPEQRDGMDYNEFTSLMMPPDIAEVHSQTVALGYQRGESKSRQGLRNRQTGGTEKSKVKLKPDPGEVPHFLSRLTPENVVQVLKNRVALALKAGPGAIRKWFELFDKDGNNEIDESELKDLLVDFGLHLSEAQVKAFMTKLDTNCNGLLDQAELIAALLPSDQFSLTASPGELKDPFSVGVTQGTGVIEGAEFRNFLRDKLIRTFVKKGDKTSAGYQVREALSRFDSNKDGTMSKMELRKALNGLGLSVDDDMATHLMQCYDKEGVGHVEFSKFVEDIDPSAFNFVFSAGMCAKSGSFESMEKEAVASRMDPPEKVRNTVRAAIRARLKKDGVKSVIREIESYGDSKGALTHESFRAALLRLGLKIDRQENVKIAFTAFSDAHGVCDVWTFAQQVEADFERIPNATDKTKSPSEKRPFTTASPKRRLATAAPAPQEKKQIGASTVVEPMPFG